MVKLVITRISADAFSRFQI